MKQVQFLQPGVESSLNTQELTTQSTPTCVNTVVYVHTVGQPVLSTTIHTYVPSTLRLQMLADTKLGVIVSNISITDDKTVKVNQIECTIKNQLHNNK